MNLINKIFHFNQTISNLDFIFIHLVLFLNCFSFEKGGGIYINSNNLSLTIYETTFINCKSLISSGSIELIDSSNYLFYKVCFINSSSSNNNVFQLIILLNNNYKLNFLNFSIIINSYSLINNNGMNSRITRGLFHCNNCNWSNNFVYSYPSAFQIYEINNFFIFQCNFGNNYGEGVIKIDKCYNSNFKECNLFNNKNFSNIVAIIRGAYSSFTINKCIFNNPQFLNIRSDHSSLITIINSSFETLLLENEGIIILSCNFFNNFEYLVFNNFHQNNCQKYFWTLKKEIFFLYILLFINFFFLKN